MMDTPLTILIHGLHLSPWYMKPLEKKLINLGLSTHRYGYRSLMQPIAVHSENLHQYLSQTHDVNRPINLVGHSLGGLVIRHFLANYPVWQIHRCVTLGTPHCGSQVAHYANKYLKPFVNQSYLGALDGTCPQLPNGIELGIIAGNRPFGLGLPLLMLHKRLHRLSTLDAQHDGTVFVSETTLQNAKDYLLLPVSHTGLLTDLTVAHQTAYFLNHGKFQHQPNH